ncbi:MFS-type transporter clz9-like [Homalodisca vitripennis]|uniref:MFS-type transporter clz9-like n=1 Tax=Homalodisca vitripennis TaxID=197043 RepID=UPI001EEBA730|nr:MFS-type transporter clz9-like [Homalodisca vitripennis]
MGSASGVVGPTMVVHSYARIPADIADSTPPDWALGKSESGWMTGELFYEYITNIFHPWLDNNNISRPVILFIDGHTSHLTLHTSQFCADNNIILVSLLPNATHLLQPMDVAVFRTLKSGWKEAVKNWRTENMSNPVLKKRHFSPLLKKCIDDRVRGEVLQNGFRKRGLHPWDASAVDYSKIEKAKITTNQQRET